MVGCILFFYVLSMCGTYCASLEQHFCVYFLHEIVLLYMWLISSGGCTAVACTRGAICDNFSPPLRWPVFLHCIGYSFITTLIQKLGGFEVCLVQLSGPDSMLKI
jgi:hypothetical protein